MNKNYSNSFFSSKFSNNFNKMNESNYGDHDDIEQEEEDEEEKINIFNKELIFSSPVQTKSTKYEPISSKNSDSRFILSESQSEENFDLNVKFNSNKPLNVTNQNETNWTQKVTFGNHTNPSAGLKSVNELPSQYRAIFSEFPYFNSVQSTVFDSVIYTDKNLVISAPTSSGKTVILELAIVQLMISLNYNLSKNDFKFKVVYMAPLKALCSEKFNEWTRKFEYLNVKCIQLTGDTEHDDENDLNFIEKSNIICTTPEKWDIMTRKWKNHLSIMNTVKLILIDEIHVLGESSRGAVIEAVVSRMKAFSNAKEADYNEQLNEEASSLSSKIRFLAVSATLPNIDDFCTWLSSNSPRITPALQFKMNETLRPVKLEKIVYGYTQPPGQTDYVFDISLSYKLANIIEKHSNSKPTLIFCSTRKSTQQTSQILAKDNKYIRSSEQKRALFNVLKQFKDAKLADIVVKNGIGYHHAGLDADDRHLIETLFLNSHLPVLISTSTLAIGINLPAHLVIIKSTKHYSSQSAFIDYSTSQILQMIGRAGRPQFDTKAVAVIMTKMEDKIKYDSLLNDIQHIESSLHECLIEHLNVEIVLNTINSISAAVNWLKSTFLYARILKNPKYYGIQINLPPSNQKNDSHNVIYQQKIDEYLVDLSKINLKELMEVNLIEECDLDNARSELKSTINGKLMARYCLAFDTMKLILVDIGYKFEESSHENERGRLIQQDISLMDLIELVSSSKELDDIKLRVNEKSILNGLNNDGKQPKTASGKAAIADNSNIIRNTFAGKIKTSLMKNNVLIQAQFGSIPLIDFSLNQDVHRIFRVGTKFSKCLIDYLIQGEPKSKSKKEQITLVKNFFTFISSCLLCQCFTTKLWHDSNHIFTQFNGLGATSSACLIKENVTSFEKILELNEQKVASIIGKNLSFATSLLEAVKLLPRFEFTWKILNTKHENDDETTLVEIYCSLVNYSEIRDNGGTLGLNNRLILVAGDYFKNVLYQQRLSNMFFIKNDGLWSKKFHFSMKKNGNSLFVSLIALDFSGIDASVGVPIFEDQNPEIELEVETTTLSNTKKRATKPKAKSTQNVEILNDEIVLNEDSSQEKPQKVAKKRKLNINKLANDNYLTDNDQDKENQDSFDESVRTNKMSKPDTSSELHKQINSKTLAGGLKKKSSYFNRADSGDSTSNALSQLNEIETKRQSNLMPMNLKNESKKKENINEKSTPKTKNARLTPSYDKSQIKINSFFPIEKPKQVDDVVQRKNAYNSNLKAFMDNTNLDEIFGSDDFTDNELSLTKQRSIPKEYSPAQMVPNEIAKNESDKNHQLKSKNNLLVVNEIKQVKLVSKKDELFVQDFKRNAFSQRGSYLRGLHERMDDNNFYMNENTEYR